MVSHTQRNSNCTKVQQIRFVQQIVEIKHTTERNQRNNGCLPGLFTQMAYARAEPTRLNSRGQRIMARSKDMKCSYTENKRLVEMA